MLYSTQPLSSTTTKSVNVPPMSIPSRLRDTVIIESFPSSLDQSV